MIPIILEFLLYAIAIGLLGLPLLLAVVYPELAEHFVKFSETMVPWIVVFIICAMLKEVFRQMARKTVEFIGRISKISTAGADIHFKQGTDENMFPENKDIHEQVKQLVASRQQSRSLAIHFFEKYIYVSIFGSQFNLLLELEKEQLSIEQVMPFYHQFLATLPEGREKPSFENWFAYLTSNFLVFIDEQTNRYAITDTGISFMRRARDAKISASSFPN